MYMHKIIIQEQPSLSQAYLITLADYIIVSTDISKTVKNKINASHDRVVTKKTEAKKTKIKGL